MRETTASREPEPPAHTSNAGCLQMLLVAARDRRLVMAAVSRARRGRDPGAGRSATRPGRTQPVRVRQRQEWT